MREQLTIRHRNWVILSLASYVSTGLVDSSFVIVGHTTAGTALVVVREEWNKFVVVTG